MNQQRQYSLLDRLLNQVQRGFTTVFTDIIATRPYPAANTEEQALPSHLRHRSGRMMRVNHCGEICAQALYDGQSITARNASTQALLQQAAHEEGDHLAWTKQRILELESRTSYLNPLWYSGSLITGMIAGLAGDQWSLGFIEETERQVTVHLSKHLDELPTQDQKSRAILIQMRIDEQNHGTTAQLAGAKPLPASIKYLMRCQAQIMTRLAFWI